MPPLSEAELALKLRQYQSISTLKASFKQTKTLKDMGVVIKSEGHFTVTRPRQVVWEVVKPSSVLITMNEKQVIIRTGKGGDAHIQVFKLKDMPSAKATQSMIGLMAWLDLDAKELSK